MRVIKSHRILLKTTPGMDKLFIEWCGVARWAYNYGLEQKIEFYKDSGKNLGNYAIAKEIVVLKSTDETSSDLFAMGTKRMPSYANA